MSDLTREVEEIARRVFREESAGLTRSIEPFVMAGEAARHLHVKPATLRYWVSVKYKNIPFHRAGKRVLFKLSELDTWSLEQAA